MEANKGYTIQCDSHTYVTLKWNDDFVFCLDNDSIYAEEIIRKIEKRTLMKFREIPVIGSKERFSGLRFFNGGWKRDIRRVIRSDVEDKIAEMLIENSEKQFSAVEITASGDEIKVELK